MPYSIELTRRASRDLAAAPAPDRKRIARKIDALARDPRPESSRQLHGEEDLYGLRSGDYRIIYQVKDEVLIVLVILIRPRGRVYEELRRLLRAR